MGSVRRRSRGQSGFTLIELIVVIGLMAVVLAALQALILAQHRFYAAQFQIARARAAARIGANLLAGELRGQSSVGGDLYAVGADSVALRSAVGFGVVCAAYQDRLLIWQTSGSFGSGASDSLLVFLEHDFSSADDDEWVSARIRGVKNAPGASCETGSPAETELRLDRTLVGVAAGAPVRAFRPHTYRLYAGGSGDWWLGQRLRNGRLQPVAGPFVAPAAGGLRLEYLDSFGTPSADRHSVVRVRITVTARSSRRIRRAGRLEFFTDSLATVVYLRNS